ncbi:flagellar filament capping protein FliD [Polynucleobacter sp. MWH-Aus1W21]|uniref:flagellar filament capping protein FliD n=1 Tax=Polynucleobacter sp. MWH-Aus1W21 TaxID=1855880 RepID=UPI001BFD6000|nr:flagellar filament capping protein FliD [Polynucleobacter sp. MWH-Aus1W21]QWD65769.1 flagellar filament capping protein FliD [Polynucleobacter sp. MWH-Aus1W21]
MAVSSSTTSTSSTGTASIDVASIVAQLMTVENKPLDAINTKITQQQVVISDLGTVKSKVSALGDALKAFQDPNSYNNAVASTSDATVVQATAANGALVGSYNVGVWATAQASKYTIAGYSSSADLASIDSVAGFSITVGSTTYNTLGTPAGTLALASTATVTDLKNWINALAVNVNASFVQTTDSSHFALMIQGSQTGLANAVSYSGITPSTAPVIVTTTGSAIATETAAVTFHDLTAGQTITMGGLTFTAGLLGASTAQVASAFASIADGTTAASINTTKTLNDAHGGAFTAGSMTGWATGVVAGGTSVTFTSTVANQDVENLSSAGSAGGLSFTTVSNAQDAVFTVNGTNFTRSSNAVSDVITGVTLNLVKSSGAPQAVNVTRGSDNSQKTIDDLITAYNDLISTYKTMTANANNSTSSKAGTFANSPTTLSFINEIKSKFALGATYGSADPVTGKFNTLSMNAMGMDLQLDGTIKFNAAAYSLASSKGLQGILAAGVKVGGTSGSLSTSPAITTTQGTALSTETAQTVFTSMAAGQTLTMAGLTFKAGTLGATAAQVANAFANISTIGTTASSLNSSKTLSDASGGAFTSGSSTAWTTSAAGGTTVTFTSATANTNVTDLSTTQTIGSSDLLAYINRQIGVNGAINSQIQNEISEGNDLAKRQAQLTERLNSIQNSFIAQYSALNALLYQLSSTSTALSGALTALTNSQSGKN